MCSPEFHNGLQETGPSNSTLIEIEDLTKLFGTNEAVTQAPSGFHLSIECGEYVAIDRNPRALHSSARLRISIPLSLDSVID